MFKSLKKILAVVLLLPALSIAQLEIGYSIDDSQYGTRLISVIVMNTENNTVVHLRAFTLDDSNLSLQEIQRRLGRNKAIGKKVLTEATYSGSDFVSLKTQQDFGSIQGFNAAVEIILGHYQNPPKSYRNLQYNSIYYARGALNAAGIENNIGVVDNHNDMFALANFVKQMKLVVLDSSNEQSGNSGSNFKKDDDSKDNGDNSNGPSIFDID